MDAPQKSKKQQTKPSSRKMPEDYLQHLNIFFETAAGKESSVSIYIRNLRFLATEMFNVTKRSCTKHNYSL